MKTACLKLCALSLAGLLLPGCSMMTQSGRQQAAYQRYVHKMSLGRAKQQRMFHSKDRPMMPVTEPSEPVESSGPMSVSSSESG
jgi:hypothetical protein